jgi:hypothetical protein
VKKHRIFVLCFPHFGTLDNWLPIVNGINDLTNSLDFTLIIPNVTIAKSFHMDNAIVKISDRIFDTVLIHAYDDVWIKKKTVINTVNWYQNNRTILRLFDVLKRALNVKLFSNILRLPFILLRNILYKKECKLKIEDISESVSTIDILFYDIHTENNNFVLDILRLFKNNNKYSLPHALSMLDSEEQTPVPFNIENIDNIKIYVYAKFQKQFYKSLYEISKNKIYDVGIPRHDQTWINTIQGESSILEDGFNGENTIVVLSHKISNTTISFDQKLRSIKNIKKIFIDRLGMRLVIKLHPNEKQERIYANKIDRVYEDILGVNDYGVTWIYSDLHVFQLGKGKKLAISLNTGAVFDMIAIGVPCIEYVDTSIQYKNPGEHKENITQFVIHGFIEGVSSYDDLTNFVDRWIDSPDQFSALSTHVYNEYFPTYKGILEKISSEILNENNIVTT